MRQFSSFAASLMWRGLSAMIGVALLVASPAAAQNRPGPDAGADPVTLVVLGDSLSAGYNLPAAAAFPAVLQSALAARGHHVNVINAGVSGDTAAGGLARVDWSVPPEADGVILALGANDMLRGFDPAHTREALDATIRRLLDRDFEVLLAGMLAGRNMGERFQRQYESIFPELAQTYGLAFHPFFLEGVAGNPALNLDDGIHPNRRGVEVMVENILPVVEDFLERIRKGEQG